MTLGLTPNTPSSVSLPVEKELVIDTEALKILDDESTILQSAEPTGIPLELEAV